MSAIRLSRSSLTVLSECLAIVTEGNYHKFTKGAQSAELRKMLLDTGDRLLVEASPFDRIWGIGHKEADAKANKENWGDNLLGKALMAVRNRLREEGSSEVKPTADAALLDVQKRIRDQKSRITGAK